MTAGMLTCRQCGAQYTSAEAIRNGWECTRQHPEEGVMMTGRTDMRALLWYRRARGLHIVDGDTLDVEVDQGFGVEFKPRLRLIGVNTPEVRGETRAAGEAATEYVRAWLEQAAADGAEWPLFLRTYPDRHDNMDKDSFRRYLVDVWRFTDGRHLNSDLIESGHARVDIRTAPMRLERG